MSFFNLCLLFYYDSRLALMAIGLLVIQSGVFAVSLRLQIRRQRRVTEVQGRLSGLLLQLLSGISKLRVAGVEDRAFGVWARQYATQSELAYDARRVNTALSTFDALFGIFASMVVYGMVAFGNVSLSTGAFLAFSAAFGTFLAAFVSMNSAVASVVGAIPSYERSLPILREVPEVEHARAKVATLKGEVDLSHVVFRYVLKSEDGEEETSSLVLNDVSIKAAPGQFVAIVGPSGSGKSTLFRLLLGFEEPQSGSIYYDGEALSHLDVQAVRSQIGVVLQNGQLMSGDIFNNIVGARALTEKDAWEAAEMAGIADEIRAMPMGMHTFISEGAGNLSGGQRQRLLIARAIVGNPKVLLFDEATSALDNYTQAKVSEALRDLRATRIVIAHRLSTVQDADRIYVLKDQRIAESGSFDELMAARGAFFELVQRQLA
jgi:ABC-type bacteriocin/lantibiotic exporter with double-glycine peptidase domain